MLPDRWNPRVWLRNAVRALNRWLMAPTPAEMEEWVRRWEAVWDELRPSVSTSSEGPSPATPLDEPSEQAPPSARKTH